MNIIHYLIWSFFKTIIRGNTVTELGGMGVLVVWSKVKIRHEKEYKRKQNKNLCILVI